MNVDPYSRNLRLYKSRIDGVTPNHQYVDCDGKFGWSEPRFQYELSEDCPQEVIDILRLVPFSEQTCKDDWTSYERVGFEAHLSYKVGSGKRGENHIRMEVYER